MAVPRLLLFASLTLFACSGHPDPTLATETSHVGSCGPDGHVLSDAAPGDRYMACDGRIRSVVISNGETEGFVSGECWTIAVEWPRTDVPLVIQFRDASHATLCPNLEAL